jgi:hypothetical protein
MSNKAPRKTTAPARCVTGPRQEELLSYLQGLAPVGQPIEFRCAQVARDLGLHENGVVYMALRKLIAKGFVERLDGEQSGAKGWLRVRRRLGGAAPAGEACA